MRASLTFFSEHDRVNFASPRFYNSDFYYEFEPFESTTHRKIFDLKFEAKIIDLKNKCRYRPDNFSDDWVKNCKHNFRLKFHMDSRAYTLESTGKFSTINDVRCEEYKLISRNGVEEYYYVDPTRPFIDYDDFVTIFPGFVMKSKKHGYRRYYEWTVKLSKSKLPIEALDIYGSFHSNSE